MDVAVSARARTRLTEDLERRRAAAPALGDVRAARLLADRVQARAVDQLLDVEVTRVGARRPDLHPLGPARPLGDGKRALHLWQCTGRWWPKRGSERRGTGSRPRATAGSSSA